MAKSLRQKLKDIDRKVHCLECNEKGEGQIQDIIAGENIIIDKTDPRNPVISSDTGSGKFTSDILLAYTFGKYPAGSVLPSNGKSTEEIVKDAYQGVLDANIVNPTFTFTRNNSNAIFEVGSTLAQQFTGTYNAGAIYGKMIGGTWKTNADPANKQADRAGALQSMTLDGETFTDGVSPKTKNSSRVITLGNNVFNGSANFLAGTAKPKRSDDSEYGAVYTTPLTLSSSISVTGLIPYFYGIINDNQTIDDINLSTLTKVVASSTGNISIPYLS